MEYDIAGEYAMIIVLAVAFLSFTISEKQKTPLNTILKVSYVLAFVCIIFSALSNIALEKDIVLGYIINTIYLALIPTFSTCNLIFYSIVSAGKLSNDAILKNIKKCLITYSVFLLILLTNIHNGNVFSITEELLYIKGPLFGITYYFAFLNIIIICITIFRKRKNISIEAIKAIRLNMLVISVVIILQEVYPDFLMTSLLNTMSVLSVHMFLENKRKLINLATGLNNPIALRYNMEQLLKKNQNFSFYVISLRSFKIINERNGVEYGDKVLQTVTDELLKYVSYEEVYRYKGDEFGILLTESPRNTKLIENILGRFEKPFTIQKYDNLNINVVCARVDNKLFGSKVNELISAVDYSISILKQPHCEKKYLYDTDVVKDIIKKTNMIQQIKHAIDNRMFQIYYQPMYSTKVGKFTQAEALVRMKDNNGGLIFPSDFIDVAEKTDLIIPMTYVILDIVCEDLRHLLDKFGDTLMIEAISVNFPYHIFLNANMEQKVMAILDKYNINPNQIKIEITERTLIEDNLSMTNTMQNMLDTGFSFELDDFGVDYSNVSTFLDLPLNIIKIDRSVLLSAMNSPMNMKFFKHLTAGISATGRIIIVEGVENREQLNFVFQTHCEYVQGYIFSKPLSFEDFMEFILPEKQKKLLNAI